jgi:excisionase family DNA binding protein
MPLEETSEVSLPPILCRIPQAATMIGHGNRFIYEAIATGKIEAVKSGKRTLVVVESLHEYARSLNKAKIKPMTRRRTV